MSTFYKQAAPLPSFSSVWKIERRVEKTDQFKTMIIFESCPKTKRYKIEELMKFVYQSGAIFRCFPFHPLFSKENSSNTETRDLGYLDLQEKKKVEVTKNEPDGNFLAPPRTSEKSTIYLDIPSNDYYYILPPKEN